MELIESMLRSEPPESKLLLGLLSGSVITAGALFVCWLSGSNPAGTPLTTAINKIMSYLSVKHQYSLYSMCLCLP